MDPRPETEPQRPRFPAPGRATPGVRRSPDGSHTSPDATRPARGTDAAGGPPRWWRALVVVVVVQVVVSLGARGLDHLLEERPHDEPAAWAAFVDLDTEGNLPTFLATLLLLVLAGAMGLRAAVAPARTSSAWWSLSVLAVALALDEATSVHERFLGPLGERLGGGQGFLTFAWVVPGALLAAAAAVVVVRAAARLGTPVRGRLGAAAAVYLLGALGVELVGASLIDQHGRGLAYHAAVAVEESLELAGVLLGLRAVLPGLAVARRPGRLVVSGGAG